MLSMGTIPTLFGREVFGWLVINYATPGTMHYTVTTQSETNQIRYFTSKLDLPGYQELQIV